MLFLLVLLGHLHHGGGLSVEDGPLTGLIVDFDARLLGREVAGMAQCHIGRFELCLLRLDEAELRCMFALLGGRYALHEGSFYIDNARREHIEFACGSQRKVNDTTFDEGTAVRHLDNHLATVLQVAHLEERSEGEGLVGAGEAVAVVTLTAAGLPTMEFIPVEGSLARQDFIGLCALKGECQHEANDCDNYSLEFVGFRHFGFLLTEGARAFPFYTLFKFRMLPNGKKSNALRAEILGPCGGNLKEEIFP